jgi:hypothetical protein
MYRLKSLLIVVSLLAFAGCSSQVTRPEAGAESKPVVKALQSLTVEMTPEAKHQLADNVKFDKEELSSTLRRTLESRDLMDAAGDFDLKVMVKDIRVRSTFNAIMWGFMAGDDHLQGDAIVLNREGAPVYTFGVNASYALGGIGGGQDSTRINWLYEEFSEKIADELTVQRDQKG